MSSVLETLQKVPPHSLEAEQSVLGSLLTDGEALMKVTDVLKTDHFYRKAHQTVYETILEVAEKGEPADLITVSEELKKAGNLDAIGGLDYLSELASAIPTTSNVLYYAKIVAEKAMLRSLIRAGGQIVSSAFEEGNEISAILDKAGQIIFEVAQKRTSHALQPIKPILHSTFEHIEDRHHNFQEGIFFSGIPSGFSDLDELTAGFQKSELIIIAARPSMGKTSFALNIAENVAISARIPVAVFSIEMAKEQLVMRMLSANANIDAHRLRTGNMRDEDWKRLGTASGKLSEAPIYIDDSGLVTVMDIRNKARRLRMEEPNLGLIIIDYLQLMQGHRSTESRQQEISEISRGLKTLARELDVPVIALSQLSRAVEARQNKRPMLSDLRESGSIEQDADVVMFIYRDEYYNPETEDKFKAEIIIAKQRNGPTDTVKLFFDKSLTKFGNLDFQHS